MPREKPLEPGQASPDCLTGEKRYGDGTPVQQGKWSEAVVPLLRKEDAAGGGAKPW